MKRNWQPAKGRKSPVAARFLAFAVCLFSFGLTASAQDDLADTAPPPIKIVSPEEQRQLDAKKDIKDRTKLSIDLMKVRITTAEKFAAERNFPEMYRELGHFHGLMDDALDYINKRDNGSGKVLDSFKRLEISLRAVAPKIEVMRRELPVRYDPYVRRLMGFLRQARAKATDSLFDDSVLPAKKPGK